MGVKFAGYAVRRQGGGYLRVANWPRMAPHPDGVPLDDATVFITEQEAGVWADTLAGGGEAVPVWESRRRTLDEPTFSNETP